MDLKPENLPIPAWKSLCSAALLEVDDRMVPVRVHDAEAAIFDRLLIVYEQPDGAQERSELENALRALLVFKKARLRLPDGTE